MSDPAEALRCLEQTTRRLRVECPWDREQDERSIVPHTVEEAYELADAARARDDRRLLDELGDVLFQVLFLSLLLEERGAGDLAQVAEHCHMKLVRRHPHVFGETEVSDAAEVLRNWDQIKRSEAGREPGIFGEVPDNLPAPLYARKLLRRAASAGRGSPGGGDSLGALAEAVAGIDGSAGEQRRFDAVGDMLFAAVAAASELKVDPELALRSAADRYKQEVLSASE